MLPILAEWLAARWGTTGDAHALSGIAGRAALAAAATFAAFLVCGPRIVRWLQARFPEPHKCDSAALAQLHRSKHATPTLGGVFIGGAAFAALALLGDLANPYLAIALLVALGLGALGIADDLIKLRTERRGLTARAKLAGQCIVALAAAALVYPLHAPLERGLELAIPWIGTFNVGLMFVPLAALVIVASSNAVNLTDGLDGLAGGCLLCALAALAAVAYAAGDAGSARALAMPYIPGAGEMAVVAAALCGGLLAFLWFNCHPASVFMGNAGSLPLGGLLGLVAVVARQELLLLLIGGVFVVEAASVIVQVAAFRTTRRRVFRCAPLHHHFQLLGWPESKIVVRFWIAAALCGVVGLSSLKWQSSETLSTVPTAEAQDLRFTDRPPQDSAFPAELF